MKTACLLAALTASLVQLPDAATGQVVEPIERVGRCRSSGIGQAFLNSHQAQALPSPQCDLAVAIGDASVSFFRSADRTPQILFSGRATSVRNFDVEIVRIGDGPVRDAIAGKCLRSFLFIMCHAVFAEGGVRKGIALTFDVRAEPEG